MEKVKLVRCPQCSRLFVDQLQPKRGYVFPVHALNAAREHRERYVQCPGSLKPIQVEHRERSKPNETQEVATAK